MKNSTTITLSQESDVSFWSHIARNLLFAVPLLVIGGGALFYGHKFDTPVGLIVSAIGAGLLFAAVLLTFSGTFVWSVVGLLFDSTNNAYNSSNQYSINDPLGFFFKKPKRTVQSVRQK